MNRILAINYELAELQKRINALLAEQRALMVQGETPPPKADIPKRKRRSKAEMEHDVTSAIRYLIDEEYNGVTQTEAEQRFGLPERTLIQRKMGRNDRKIQEDAVAIVRKKKPFAHILKIFLPLFF